MMKAQKRTKPKKARQNEANTARPVGVQGVLKDYLNDERRAARDAAARIEERKEDKCDGTTPGGHLSATLEGRIKSKVKASEIQKNDESRRKSHNHGDSTSMAAKKPTKAKEANNR